ncbi:fluoride efflux transporter CrcB [Marinicrinis lubricantis]|uniref:Fluoride-specific ion channel FluC n=1 Tax=Marinicrinis lubricantis TaxID=2086470 RepID=A0ABW1IQT5_9BACL
MNNGTIDKLKGAGSKEIHLIYAIAAAGAVGALLRYSISLIFSADAPGQDFPWATLICNVSGCFCLSFLTFAVPFRWLSSPEVKAGLTTGLLGSFTTFSTFSIETRAMLAASNERTAVLYVALSVILGIVFTCFGYVAAGFVDKRRHVK